MQKSPERSFSFVNDALSRVGVGPIWPVFRPVLPRIPVRKGLSPGRLTGRCGTADWLRDTSPSGEMCVQVADQMRHHRCRTFTFMVR